MLTDYDELTAETVSKLASIKMLKYLQVSLDGSKSDEHDFLRGTGSFKHAINRLKLLANSGINYAISTTIHKKNIDQLYDIAQISKRFNASYFYVNPLSPYGRAKGNLIDLLLDQKQLDWLAEAYYDLQKNHEICSGNPFWERIILEEADISEVKPFNNVVDAFSAGAFLFAVDMKGDVYLDSKYKSESLMCLGNLLSDDLSGIWSKGCIEDVRCFIKMGEPPPFLSLEKVSNIVKKRKEMAS